MRQRDTSENDPCKPLVLIVDDDEFVRTSFQHVLESNGYDTISASGGREGLDLMAKLSAELVLLDLKLPDTAGLEVLEQLKRAHPNSTVLVITGYASIESAVEAMRMGAYDYVVKPCKPKELLLRVGRMLEKSRLEQALDRTKAMLQALNRAALSVQNARTLDLAFRRIGAQMQAVGMECIVYGRSDSAPQNLVVLYLSLSDERIARLEAEVGVPVGALRIPYEAHAFLAETMSQGTAQWHPLEDRFLRGLFPSDGVPDLDSVRTVLGGNAFVRVPLRFGGRIQGILVAVGSRLTDRDVQAMVAFAHQISAALDNVRWMEQISRSEKELKELSARLMTIQEEERRRISRDLHDSVAQSLSAIKLDLELLAKGKARDGADPAARLEENIRLLGVTMKELRSISADLRPQILDDLGLIPTLRWYTGMYGGQTAHITFSEDLPDDPLLARKAEIAIFRIVQEALSNAMRHGHANCIAVRVAQVNRVVHISVEDDGVGFEVDRTMQDLRQIGGLGLVTMRERARLLNAEFRIEAEPGKGTRVFLAVPCEPRAATPAAFPDGGPACRHGSAPEQRDRSR